jgi:hypothetical protein
VDGLGFCGVIKKEHALVNQRADNVL